MTAGKKKPDQKLKWPPESLIDFVAVKSGESNTLNPLNQTERDALERFINPNDIALTEAYQRLLAIGSPERIDTYLRQVCDSYLNLDMYNPIHEKEYKDWIKKISQCATDLAELVEEIPSVDLVLPDSLSNAGVLVLAMLETYENEIARDHLLAGDQYLLKILRKMPLSMIFTEMVRLANEEKNKSPLYYWQKELGIQAPRKQGDANRLARNQIFIRSIKRLTLDVFNRPCHDLIATFVNRLLDTESHTADSISHIPM